MKKRKHEKGRKGEREQREEDGKGRRTRRGGWRKKGKRQRRGMEKGKRTMMYGLPQPISIGCVKLAQPSASGTIFFFKWGSSS